MAKFDHCLARIGATFVVFTVAATATVPCIATLNDPPNSHWRITKTTIITVAEIIRGNETANFAQGVPGLAWDEALS